MREGDVEGAILQSLQKGEETPLLRRIRKENQILLHNYKKEFMKVVPCALVGCKNKFNIVLIPNQILYPKYCENHRTPFKRDHFLSINP